MKQYRRLALFLTLNALVSACVTLSVLLVWDQARGPLPRGLLAGMLDFSPRPSPTALETPASTPLSQPTPTEEYIVYQVQSGETFESIAAAYNVSVDELVLINGFSQSQPLGAGEVLLIPKYPQGTVVIKAVIGAGDLSSERVLLEHRGEGQLSLVGWRMEDDKGNLFIFPQFALIGSGAVNVYTRAGVNTVVELYWGLDAPVWGSGSIVILRDSSGKVRSTYTVP